MSGDLVLSEQEAEGLWRKTGDTYQMLRTIDKTISQLLELDAERHIKLNIEGKAHAVEELRWLQANLAENFTQDILENLAPWHLNHQSTPTNTRDEEGDEK